MQIVLSSKVGAKWQVVQLQDVIYSSQMLWLHSFSPAQYCGNNKGALKVMVCSCLRTLKHLKEAQSILLFISNIKYFYN